MMDKVYSRIVANVACLERMVELLDRQHVPTRRRALQVPFVDPADLDQADFEELVKVEDAEAEYRVGQFDNWADQRRKGKKGKGTGPAPKDDSGWRQKCELLQEKLARREAELGQARNDLELLRSDGIGPNDPGNELKQRLLDLTKKNRRFQVTCESQKVRLQQLEAEVKKPKEEARKQAEELVMQRASELMGDGLGNVEDWKKKYLVSSNKLQEVRHEAQELRAQLQKQRKVLLKEVGSEEALQQALAVADDPTANQWKGRAAQISQLQRQLRELREKVAAGGDTGLTAAAVTMVPAAAAAAQPKVPAVSQAADKRREEFERLQEEVEKLRAEQAEAKSKQVALKSRAGLLESQLREMKANSQFLLRKSDDDDALVAAMRRQMGRRAEAGDVEELDEGGAAAAELEGLRQENEELQGQLERQAQIVVQLRQKSLAASCENGSVRLGPKSAESSVSDRQLIDRVRFLEAENQKAGEHVRLLREQLEEGGGGSGSSRPFSAESTLNLKDKLRQLSERLAAAERENKSLRQQPASGGDDSPASRPGSRSSSRGMSGAGPDAEQVLRHNEALKREVVRLRAQLPRPD
ncbi:unnamed protein product [Polarella glacialis]|uniref:Uncharacterized protein n=1 Tax=Polarella glacialis TaxID=89957 RepID=A0A813D7M7_POLGL|nr:unnamed protein product [Polarella glacialis]